MSDLCNPWEIATQDRIDVQIQSHVLYDPRQNTISTLAGNAERLTVHAIGQ